MYVNITISNTQYMLNQPKSQKLILKTLFHASWQIHKYFLRIIDDHVDKVLARLLRNWLIVPILKISLGFFLAENTSEILQNGENVKINLFLFDTISDFLKYLVFECFEKEQRQGNWKILFLNCGWLWSWDMTKTIWKSQKVSALNLDPKGV